MCMWLEGMKIGKNYQTAEFGEGSFGQKFMEGFAKDMMRSMRLSWRSVKALPNGNINVTLYRPVSKEAWGELEVYVAAFFRGWVAAKNSTGMTE